MLLLSVIRDWLWDCSDSLSLATSCVSQCHFITANIHLLRTALQGTEGWKAVQVFVHGDLRICAWGYTGIVYKPFHSCHSHRPLLCGHRNAEFLCAQGFALLLKSMLRTSPQPWVQNGRSLQILPWPLLILAFPTIQNLFSLMSLCWYIVAAFLTLLARPVLTPPWGSTNRVIPFTSEHSIPYHFITQCSGTATLTALQCLDGCSILRVLKTF